jgi:hypothetical protein
MTLPATFREAAAIHRKEIALEARIIAGDWIARRGFEFFHPDSEEKFSRPLMKWYAQLHPFCCDEIVYFSERGSQQAKLALEELIAERIDRGEELGRVLGAYAIRVLNPARPHPGPSGPAGTFVRDLGILLLMQALIDQFGNQLPTTQSNDEGGPSFSSIAADALSEAGVGILMTYRNVRKIWRRYLPALAGTRYASHTKFALGIPNGCKGLFD